eukprot:SAG11_NODE_708_length_7648_cov_3.486687_4_plen_69_part_00
MELRFKTGVCVTQPRFNQDGVEAERAEVRQRLLPLWQSMNWQVREPIERLWAGERNLQVGLRAIGRLC